MRRVERRALFEDCRQGLHCRADKHVPVGNDLLPGAAAAAGSALVAAAALAFGLGHLARLGLPSSDGRALRALLRERAAPPVSTR